MQVLNEYIDTPEVKIEPVIVRKINRINLVDSCDEKDIFFFGSLSEIKAQKCH